VTRMANSPTRGFVFSRTSRENNPQERSSSTLRHARVAVRRARARRVARARPEPPRRGWGAGWAATRRRCHRRRAKRPRRGTARRPVVGGSERRSGRFVGRHAQSRVGGCVVARGLRDGVRDGDDERRARVRARRGMRRPGVALRHGRRTSRAISRHGSPRENENRKLRFAVPARARRRATRRGEGVSSRRREERCRRRVRRNRVKRLLIIDTVPTSPVFSRARRVAFSGRLPRSLPPPRLRATSPGSRA